MDPSIRNMPENFGALEYQNITNIHPLALVAVIVLGIAMLCVPRRRAVLPMLIIACFISSVQKISILNMDFNLLRIMVIFGVVRLMIQKEYLGFHWRPLDTAMVLWTISSMVIYILRQGDFAAVTNRLGFGFDAFGMYFLFRCLIRNWEDANTIVFGLLLISIPVALFFIMENRTGRNLFSVFGGVPEITRMRDGRLRCQGAFPHAILAGCFWASLMPLFAAYWWKSLKDRVWAVVGLSTSSIMVICCASSTPVMGVLAGLVGGLFFIVRRYMRVVRWSILLLLTALHWMMEAPVWHLISRVSAVGGSTSYFRYMLINGTINHFSEWALLGTKSTAHWFWGAQDITNQYVLEGVRGGFLTLVLFVVVIAFAFRDVGNLWRRQKEKPYNLALSWALGVSLFVHCVNFIGVSYFGQVHILWYLLLAMIGSLSAQTQNLVTPSLQSSSRILRLRNNKNTKLQGVYSAAF